MKQVELLMKYKKYLYILLPVIAGAILVLLFWGKIKAIFRKDIQPITEIKESDRKAYAIAMQLVDALGTNREMNWFQKIGNWSEDEYLVVKLINKNWLIIKEIEGFYAQFSESGSLWQDVQRYLSAEDIEQLKITGTGS